MLLATLNGNVTFTAGEAFRRAGKTDILVIDDRADPDGAQRAVFIAELKIWDGPKRFSDGISAP